MFHSPVSAGAELSSNFMVTDFIAAKKSQRQYGMILKAAQNRNT
jgi:hypothetical protein